MEVSWLLSRAVVGDEDELALSASKSQGIIMDQGDLRYDCDCDAVLAMEEIGVGVEEILQYAGAVLPRREVSILLRGLKAILDLRAQARVQAPTGGHSKEQPFSGGETWNDWMT